MRDDANRLLLCPVGCAFLLTIAQDRTPVAVAVTPSQAFARAAAALRDLNPWSVTFTKNVSTALSYGPALADLAQEAVAHPASNWWTEPMDRTRQILLVESDTFMTRRGLAASESETRWEAYAERPVGWRVTSTLQGEYSCLDTMVASGVGEWDLRVYYRRATGEVEATARVLELASPEDWHTLCVSYPRVNDNAASPGGAGTLTPDWRRVAAQWDGIHLTFMGLLTAPFVRRTSAAGSTMLWSWDTEGTLWLPEGPVGTGAPLPPVSTAMAGPSIIAPLAFNA